MSGLDRKPLLVPGFEQLESVHGLSMRAPMMGTERGVPVFPVGLPPEGIDGLSLVPVKVDVGPDHVSIHREGGEPMQFFVFDNEHGGGVNVFSRPVTDLTFKRGSEGWEIVGGDVAPGCEDPSLMVIANSLARVIDAKQHKPKIS